MPIYEEKLIRAGVADVDNDISPCGTAHAAEAAQANVGHLVSAVKQLLDLRSQKCVESEEVANEEVTSTHSSECTESSDSTTPSVRSPILPSVTAASGSPEDLSACEDILSTTPSVWINRRLLVCQPTASTSKSSKQSRGSKAAAQQKRVWEAARAAQMETVMAQWQMAQWHAAQMVQWEHVAFANQAGQGPKQAVRWKEGDTFEVESALVTCDKTKMCIEPPARGTVMRLHRSCHKWMMSVKFDNMGNCKWIGAKDYHKLRKAVQYQAALW